MDNTLQKKYNNIINVDTTNILAEGSHPRVYYKIDPNIGYVVCNYTNTCFKLSKEADLNTKKLFIYKDEN